MKSLREWRIERLYSIRRLAEVAELSPRTIHEAEHGRRLPTLATIRKLCDVLDVAPGEVEEFAASMDAAKKEAAA